MIEKRSNKIFRCLLIMLIFVVTLTITSCKKEVSGYSDIKRIVHKEILNQKGNNNNTYYVVIYSTTCTFCEDLEDSVVEYCNFVNKKNGCIKKDYPPMYALNINASKDNPDIKASDNEYTNFTGTSDYKDIKFSAAPALVVVTDKKVEKFISSKVTNTPVSDIRILLNKTMKRG